MPFQWQLFHFWSLLYLVTCLWSTAVSDSRIITNDATIPTGTWDSWTAANTFYPARCLDHNIRAANKNAKKFRKIRERQVGSQVGHEEACADDARILLRYRQGGASREEVRLAIFGHNNGIPVPLWKWHCFWEGMLAAAVHQNSANGTWLPPVQVPEQDALAFAQNHSVQWPLLLKGMSNLILPKSSSHLWQSDAWLAQMFPGKYMFAGCKPKGGDDAAEITLKQWFSNRRYLFFKTDNWKIWSQTGNDNSLLSRRVAEQILTPGNLPNVHQITLNWSREEGVRHWPLHHDGDAPQIACQVAGEKTWVLLPPEALGHITNLESLQNGIDTHAKVAFDPFNASTSLARFPDIQDTMPPPMVVQVSQGDCIKLPAQWWHVTESRGRSISLNIEVLGHVEAKGTLNHMFDKEGQQQGGWPFGFVFEDEGSVPIKMLKSQWQSPTDMRTEL